MNKKLYLVKLKKLNYFNILVILLKVKHLLMKNCKNNEIFIKIYHFNINIDDLNIL